MTNKFSNTEDIGAFLAELEKMMKDMEQSDTEELLRDCE